MERNVEGNSSDEMTGSLQLTDLPYLEGNSSESLQFTDLPYDVIHQIFSSLDVKSLCRLAQVCRLFRHISCQDSLWLRHLNGHTVQIEDDCRQVETTGNGRRGHRRVDQGLNRKSRFKAGENWKEGTFRESSQISHSTNIKLMPWIQREDSTLWASTGRVIRCFRIQKNGNLREWKGRQLRGLNDDVSRFVVKEGRTVSAGSDGSIGGWNHEEGNMLFHLTDLHDSNVHCVDFFHQTIVTGSRDRTVKILSVDENNHSFLQNTIYMGDRVWSLSLSPDPSILAVGTAGNKGLSALTIWDINQGELNTSLESGHQVGAGILHIKFDDHHTLLTCGYDTNLKMWDLRTNTCVATWMEPFDSAVHCFHSDGNNYIVTGTARYGMSRLWDKRKHQSIQQYYTGRKRSSPVYSLTFDPGRLYIALDSGVHKLDFT